MSTQAHIPHWASHTGKGDNFMDVKSVRYANGRMLLEQTGSLTALAELLGKSSSQMSHILGTNPTKGIGEKIARELESAFGLPYGWMDTLQPDSKQGARFQQLLSERKIPPSALAKQLGSTPQSINNWRNRGVPASAALAAAEILGCQPSDICGSLKPTGARAKARGYSPALRIVEAEDRHTWSEEFVSLPVLAVELAAGNGFVITEEQAEYELPFRRHTLAKLGVPVQAAKVVRVSGDSMAAYLNDGDCIGVNTADTAPIRDGKVYAFRDTDLLRVKYLMRQPGGGLILRSHDRDAYPDEELTREQVEQRIQIIGRMFWRSGIDY